MGRVLTLLNVGYYIPDILLSISLCGTNLHTTLFNMQDVARGGASDRDRSAPIKWTRGPRIQIKTTCVINKL